MADLTIRRIGSANVNDPFQMIRASMRRMQDLFRDPLFELEPTAWLEGTRELAYAPDFEVRETADGLVFQADLPGVKENDIDVMLVGSRLRITGKREVEQESRGDTWYAAERSYGSFSRSFQLPDGCDTDNVDARLENGVLTVRLGKRQGAQPRRIALGGERRAIEAGANVSCAAEVRPAAAAPVSGDVPSAPAGGAYGGMYGRTAPEAAKGREHSAAAGFEHAEPASANPARRPGNVPDKG